MENKEKIEIMDLVAEILKRGSEAVIRKRSKNGEQYIEVAEQQYKNANKFKTEKK